MSGALEEAREAVRRATETLLNAIDALVQAAREHGYRDGFDDGNAAGFRDGVDHVSSERGDSR
jgi:hypothetical protein